MNDLDFHYFFEVARTLNFSQAAEQLYISQPALSRCIIKLEQEFGVPLFIRNKRDVSLTSAGIALLKNYPQVQRANYELCRAVQCAAQGIDLKLTIGMQEGHLVTSRLKRIFADFQLSHPNITIEVVSLIYTALFDQLNSHKIDLAFSFDFPDNIHPNMECKRFEKSENHVLISKDHPSVACEDPQRRLEMLAGMDLVVVERTIVPNVVSFLIDQCMANGFRPANVRYAPDYLTLYNWLIMEKGFALMNKEDLFSSSNICFIPMLKSENVDYCIFWHKDLSNPAALEFIDYCPACSDPDILQKES